MAGLATIERGGLLVHPRGLLMRVGFATIQPGLLVAAVRGLYTGPLTSHFSVPARSGRTALRSSRELVKRRPVIRAV